MTPDLINRPEVVSEVTRLFLDYESALMRNIDHALAVMREERDAGQTHGMLCGRPNGVVPEPVHASTAAEWPAFEAAARPWLETAVARSKPPNVRGNRPARGPQE